MKLPTMASTSSSVCPLHGSLGTKAWEITTTRPWPTTNQCHQWFGWQLWRAADECCQLLGRSMILNPVGTILAEAPHGSAWHD